MIEKAKIAALLAVVFLCTAVGVFLLGTLKDAQKLLKDSDALIIQTRKDEKETTKHLNQVLENVNATTARLKEASGQEVQYWNKATRDADKAVSALRLFISLTNRRFNDGVAPQVQDTVKKMGDTAEQMTKAIQELKPTVKNINQTSVELQKLVADPNWKKTLSNMQVMTGHAASITQVADKKVKSKRLWFMVGAKAAFDVTWKAIMIAGAL